MQLPAPEARCIYFIPDSCEEYRRPIQITGSNSDPLDCQSRCEQSAPEFRSANNQCGSRTNRALRRSHQEQTTLGHRSESEMLQYCSMLCLERSYNARRASHEYNLQVPMYAHQISNPDLRCQDAMPVPAYAPPRFPNPCMTLLKCPNRTLQIQIFNARFPVHDQTVSGSCSPSCIQVKISSQSSPDSPPLGHPPLHSSPPPQP
jgi:hypothetical protein